MMTPDTHDLATTPFQSSTLVELLRWRAQHQPERRAYTFLVDGEAEEVSLTYAELDHQARAIGAWLQSWASRESGRCCSIRPGSSISRRFSVASMPVWWLSPCIRRGNGLCRGFWPF